MKGVFRITVDPFHTIMGSLFKTIGALSNLGHKSHTIICAFRIVVGPFCVIMSAFPEIIGEFRILIGAHRIMIGPFRLIINAIPILVGPFCKIVDRFFIQYP